MSLKNKLKASSLKKKTKTYICSKAGLKTKSLVFSRKGNRKKNKDGQKEEKAKKKTDERTVL